MFHRHSSIADRIRQLQYTSLFWNKSCYFWASLLSGNHIDYTINPCRLCVLQNTLGGKPLISRSANTCVFLLSVPLMLQAFQHNSGLSPLQRITLCQCVWHHTWLVVFGANHLMVTSVVNHYQFRAQISLNILPVPQPHFMLKLCLFHHIDDNCLILWSFSTQKLQVWMLATIVNFAIHLTSSIFVLTTFWEYWFFLF